MSIGQSLLPEFDQEMEATRSVLSEVPEDKLDWQPHEKSMTLGRLAAHCAELVGWIRITLEEDEFDVSPPGGEPHETPIVTSRAELLEMLNEGAELGRAIIAATGDDEFMKPWTFKAGGEALFSAPKIGVYRKFIMNHLIHHRGQLTVYLRLVGAKVPQTTGPTADYPEM